MSQKEEVTSQLVGISRAQMFALVALLTHPVALRERNCFVIDGAEQQRFKSETIEALAKKGLAVISYAGGRHRVRLTENGRWYARSATRKWSASIGSVIADDHLMAG